MNRNRLLNKYLLLALILTALFAMTGCRTRITNNSEVSNVYYDEDGFLSETYQMRRDELGLSTAESPIFPDLGGGETADDFDSSEETGLNYEPEEDTYVEPPTTTTTTPSTTRHYSSSGNRYSSPSTTTTTATDWVIVTLDANGGKDVTGALKVVKGEKYGKRQKLPTPEWKDNTKTFKEWNTKKDGTGDKVTNDTVVKTSSAHTLYAQWKKSKSKPDNKDDKKGTVKVKYVNESGEEIEKSVTTTGKVGAEYKTTAKKISGYELKETPKNSIGKYKAGTITVTYIYKKKTNSYTVTFDDGNGNHFDETVEEGGAAKGPKENPKREGFEFDGWEGDFSNIKEDITIKAKWKVTPSYWDETIKSAAKEKDKTYYAKSKEDIFTQCIGAHVDNPDSDYDYAVAFAENADKAKEVKQNLIGDGIPESKIKIFSKPPKDTDELILYKLSLYEAIYGEDLGIGAVEDATGLKSRDCFEEFQ